MKRMLTALAVLVCLAIPALSQATPVLVQHEQKIRFVYARAGTAINADGQFGTDSAFSTHAGSKVDTTQWFKPAQLPLGALADSIPMFVFKTTQSSHNNDGTAATVTTASGTTTWALQVTMDDLGTINRSTGASTGPTVYIIPDWTSVTITARGTGNYIYGFVPTGLGQLWSGARAFRIISTNAGSGTFSPSYVWHESVGR